VLNEKSRCPNCSAKCRAEDLLPNVSLRHAVEVFLRSQVFADGVEDIHHHASGKDTFWLLSRWDFVVFFIHASCFVLLVNIRWGIWHSRKRSVW